MHDVKFVSDDQPEFAAIRKDKRYSVLSGGKQVINGAIRNVVYLVNKAQLPIDSLIKIDAITNDVVYAYPGILQIVYKREKETIPYLVLANKPVASYQSSFLIINDQINILPNGKYFDPQNVAVKGFMDWEKFSELLPLDHN